MKTEIVKYHNDLNKIIFPNFREQELNIFNNVMQRVFDRGDEVVEFSAEEVSKFFGSAYNKKLLAWMLHEMGERMAKIGFKFISEKNNQSRRAFFNSLSMSHIWRFLEILCISKKSSQLFLYVAQTPVSRYCFNVM